MYAAITRRTKSLLLAGVLASSLVVLSGATAVSQTGPQVPVPTTPTPSEASRPGSPADDRNSSFRTGGFEAEFDALAADAGVLVEGTASLFVPISSYRAYDSRNDPSGKWVSGDFGLGPVLADEFGDLRIPGTATAVAFNVAAVGTEHRGFVQVYGPGTDLFSTSTVNWTQWGLNIANSGSTMIGESDGELGLMGLAVGGPAGARTHIIVDITGYYI